MLRLLPKPTGETGLDKMLPLLVVAKSFLFVLLLAVVLVPQEAEGEAPADDVVEVGKITPSKLAVEARQSRQ